MKNQIFRALFLLLVLTLAACGNEISPFLEETKSASQTSTATQIVFDATYDIGIIVITQYYTFLGHGLHEEAYWLQSTPHREIYSVEEYVDRMKPNFRNVEIITIQPLNKWLADQEQPTVPDPPGKKRFYVRIKAWGEGNMSGSVMSCDTQIDLSSRRWALENRFLGYRFRIFTGRSISFSNPRV